MTLSMDSLQLSTRSSESPTILRTRSSLHEPTTCKPSCERLARSVRMSWVWWSFSEVKQMFSEVSPNAATPITRSPLAWTLACIWAISKITLSLWWAIWVTSRRCSPDRTAIIWRRFRSITSTKATEQTRSWARSPSWHQSSSRSIWCVVSSAWTFRFHGGNQKLSFLGWGLFCFSWFSWFALSRLREDCVTSEGNHRMVWIVGGKSTSFHFDICTWDDDDFAGDWLDRLIRPTFTRAAELLRFCPRAYLRQTVVSLQCVWLVTHKDRSHWQWRLTLRM